MRKRNLWQLLSLFLLTGIIYACTKDNDEDSSSKETLPPEVAEAKAWFESQTQVKDGLLPWKPVAGGKETVLTPDWRWVFSSEDSNYKMVEVHVEEAEPLNCVTAECSEKYRQTGDKRYLASMIRLVIRTHKDTKVKDGFIMLAFPDLSYLEAHKDNPLNGVSYLKRPSDFSGMVIFYDMNSEFVNGWIYQEGVAYPFTMATE